MSNHKALSRVSIKDADQGLVEAVFATLNVVDSDGDVTVNGAFEDGAEVRISAYGHSSWGGALPVGKGVIRETGDEAVLAGQFFMETPHGRDTFATVKGLGSLGEWSYGFDVLEGGTGQFNGEDVNFLRKLRVFEVSPVLLGAGVNTRTIGVKDARTFVDEAHAVRDAVEALVNRASSLAEVKRGELTIAKREELVAALDALDLIEPHRLAVNDLLEQTDPNKHRGELLRELMRFEQLRTTIQGDQ